LTSAPPTTTAPPPPAPEAAGGGIVCPVQGPVSFVDSFGAPRSGGRAHQGVDMMAAMGTPTVAPASGRVDQRGATTGGLSWWLYGDNGDEYFGTHLSGDANEGVGWVAAGTVIGYVGDSGNAGGTPHLHFEIHRRRSGDQPVPGRRRRVLRASPLLDRLERPGPPLPCRQCASASSVGPARPAGP
jgi:murein DD-endopeptidase MepM/ murein hydrolase activator NlpD